MMTTASTTCDTCDTGSLSVLKTRHKNAVGVFVRDTVTESTISLWLDLERAERFAADLLAAVAAKRDEVQA